MSDDIDVAGIKRIPDICSEEDQAHISGVLKDYTNGLVGSPYINENNQVVFQGDSPSAQTHDPHINLNTLAQLYDLGQEKGAFDKLAAEAPEIMQAVRENLNDPKQRCENQGLAQAYKPPFA